MLKVIVIAQVPEALINEFLQVLRDFDVKYPGCHFGMTIDAPGKSVEEIEEMIGIEPPLAFRKTIS